MLVEAAAVEALVAVEPGDPLVPVAFALLAVRQYCRAEPKLPGVD